MDSIMDIKMFHYGWKYGKVCKKSWQKYQVLKEAVFTKTLKNKFKFYLNFILKLLNPQLGL
jgi:hypothetical protein